MGSGIAREIRARYPEAYEVDCKTIVGDYKKLGTFSSVKTNDGKFVIYNCYSQYRYGREKRHTNYEAVYTGLSSIEQNARELGLTTLSLPYNMGCMLGGGSWRIVSAIIDEVFKESPIDLYICRYTP
jgi:O-acetyl-ADP-ribose deacetylase (regulator of RNase III)